MERRKFIENSLLTTTAFAFAGTSFATTRKAVKQHKLSPLTKLERPVAIAMWDFSWLLRHHKGGSFENFDQVLDELVRRGYNAIRLDVFPHLIAADSEGKVQERFFHPKEDWTPALWGNEWSIYSTPRESLVEFMKKCYERDIHPGLATWFLGHGTNRNSDVKGLKGFVRVWDETLTFLDNQGLLDGVLYVDLINEYPLWHGFDWLKEELDAMGDQEKFVKSNPDAHIADVDFLKKTDRKYNPIQERFYKKFITDAINELKGKWPDLDFFASLSNNGRVPWEEMNFESFDVLDAHVWFTHYADFGTSTGYFENIHSSKNDIGFEKTFKAMKTYWAEHKTDLVNWMDKELELRQQIATINNMVSGNTEGWGPINWYEHPLLDWNFTKEAGTICTDLALKHGFKFICTSNFTHPHFKSIWEDVAWHKALTSRIKNG